MKEFQEYISTLEERIKRLEKHLGLPEGLEYGKDDSVYEEAKNLVIKEQRASSSYLQRKLKITHIRAIKLIEALEIEGAIGPKNEDLSPRKVFQK
jgi:DNA segregation ATPase FtsK/SpoIIIE-like protein